MKKILWDGSNPRNLPVLRGGFFEFKVSDAAAQALGIAIPAVVRQIADQCLNRSSIELALDRD